MKIIKKIFIITTMGIKKFSDPYFQGVPAQLSFYYTLSIVPILILITQVLGLIFDENIETATSWLLERTDIALGEGLLDAITFRTAYAANIFFIILLVWAASRAQFSMMRIANYTFSDGKMTGKGYFKDRFKAIIVMGFTLSTVIFGVVVLAYGEHILDLIFGIFGLEDEGQMIWLYIRWPIALALYFFMVLLNYYILPSDRRALKKHLPGTIFASLGLWIVTYVYSKYTSLASNYDIIYGSLASVAALILWFYFLAWVLTFGIIFNKVWDEYHFSKKD